MNKYQKAFKTILEDLHPDGGLTTLKEVELIEELIDKETPTKTSKSHCGKCNIGYLVQSRGDKYCHVCGYKIDWSDTD